MLNSVPMCWGNIPRHICGFWSKAVLGSALIAVLISPNRQCWSRLTTWRIWNIIACIPDIVSLYGEGSND